MAAPPASPVKTLRSVGPIIVVILVVAVALLGYYQIVFYPTIAASSTTSTTTSTGPPEKLVVVTIPQGAQDPNTPSSQTYLPDVITVYIGYNASVRWVNNDTTVHTVTAVGTPPDPRFTAFGPSSPYNNVFPVGQGTPTSVNFTFTIPGIYNYTCSYHAWMKGSVIVKNAPPGLITNTTSTSQSKTNSTFSTSSTLTKASVSAIFPASQLELVATVFANSLATLTGSGTEPWSVNLSSSAAELTSSIPAILTKTA